MIALPPTMLPDGEANPIPIHPLSALLIVNVVAPTFGSYWIVKESLPTSSRTDTPGAVGATVGEVTGVQLGKAGDVGFFVNESLVAAKTLEESPQIALIDTAPDGGALNLNVPDFTLFVITPHFVSVLRFLLVISPLSTATANALLAFDATVSVYV